jgi:hypothetical protein
MSMHWQDVQTAWDQLGDQIQAQWPATNALDLAMIAGDKSRFTTYLAEVHDLTPFEADEAIDLWLLRIRTDHDRMCRTG